MALIAYRANVIAGKAVAEWVESIHVDGDVASYRFTREEDMALVMSDGELQSLKQLGKNQAKRGIPFEILHGKVVSDCLYITRSQA